MRPRIVAAALAAVLLPLAAACSGGAEHPDAAKTLSVLAGSELSDMLPILEDARKATGITIRLEYTGTISGIDQIVGGKDVDAAWFAQDKYLSLADTQHRIADRQRIMLTPVVLGIKPSAERRLGWSGAALPWKTLVGAAAEGRFRYAMTNPAASNSGFATVVAVSTAMSGTGDALRPTDVNHQQLEGFFRGQTIVSGSSGWLSDAYVADQNKVDGIFTYEASIVELNASGKLSEKLDVVYPADGTMTADYPLDLLNPAKKDAYAAVVAYLKRPEVQSRIVQTTHRRPLGGAPSVPVTETSFPATADDVRNLILRFLNVDRRPAHVIFVIDKTGSMREDDGTGTRRIDRIHQSFAMLTGSDPSLTGQFAKLEDRAVVTLMPFAVNVEATETFEIHGRNDTATYAKIRAFSDSLEPGGGTALYTALEAAYTEAERDQAADRNRYVSIVLFTDGESNRGDEYPAFQRKWTALPAAVRAIHVFPVFIGEGSPAELGRIATLTGGKSFDARRQDLAEIFKAIRGYN